MFPYVDLDLQVGMDLSNNRVVTNNFIYDSNLVQIWP